MSQESKTQEACIECEDINVSNSVYPLTSRETKGYTLEIDTQNMLSILGYHYYANPVSPVTWKSNNIKHRVDIELYNGIKIECKNIDGKVFRSWYVRDWKNKGSCVYTYRGDLKLSSSVREEFHPILFHYSLLPTYLEYNIPLFRDFSVTNSFEVSSFFEVSREVSRDKDISGRCKDVSERVNTGKNEGKSTVSESFRPKSSTFRDKLRWKMRRIPKFISETLSIFEPFLTVLSRLWNDTSGNVSLTKRSKTTWKPRYGFYVSDNQVQTRLFRHTYPCKYKIPVICTSRKKVRYICLKEIDNSSLRSLRLYNNNLYCFCPEYGDERCWLNEYICFNVMSRREDCSWSRSTWKEECIYEDNLKRKMKEEMILEKINKDKNGMVKV
jgi:hypothetical protein